MLDDLEIRDLYRRHRCTPGPLTQRPLGEIAEPILRGMLDHAVVMGYTTGSVGSSVETNDRHFRYHVSYRIERLDAPPEGLPRHEVRELEVPDVGLCQLDIRRTGAARVTKVLRPGGSWWFSVSEEVTDELLLQAASLWLQGHRQGSAGRPAPGQD